MFQKIDSTATSVLRLFKIVGYWVFVGRLPDGDFCFGVSIPRPVFGNEHRWAEFQFERKLITWAGKKTTLELEVVLEQLNKEMALARLALESKAIGQFRYNLVKKEKLALVSAIHLAMNERGMRVSRDKARNST